MTLSVSHGVRARQWLAALRVWLSGKAGRLWFAELAGGADLAKAVTEVGQQTVEQLKPKPDQFDNVAPYVRELTALQALRRDAQYGQRNRRWLWQRAAQTKATGMFHEWTAYARRNPSDQVMKAARVTMEQAEHVKLSEVIGRP